MSANQNPQTPPTTISEIAKAGRRGLTGDLLKLHDLLHELGRQYQGKDRKWRSAVPVDAPTAYAFLEMYRLKTSSGTGKMISVTALYLASLGRAGMNAVSRCANRWAENKTHAAYAAVWGAARAVGMHSPFLVKVDGEGKILLEGSVFEAARRVVRFGTSDDNPARRAAVDTIALGLMAVTVKTSSGERPLLSKEDFDKAKAEGNAEADERKQSGKARTFDEVDIG